MQISAKANALPAEVAFGCVAVRSSREACAEVQRDRVAFRESRSRPLIKVIMPWEDE